MGLLNKLFGSQVEESEAKMLPWIPLSQSPQLEDIKRKSMIKTQVIFKYSTRCGISRLVLSQFEEDYNFSETDFDLYFLDLISHRDVSNEVSYKFQVIHESPQILIIKNGVTIAHSSHGAINDMDLKRFI